jgi:hypothetical protein
LKDAGETFLKAADDVFRRGSEEQEEEQGKTRYLANHCVARL